MLFILITWLRWDLSGFSTMLIFSLLKWIWIQWEVTVYLKHFFIPNHTFNAFIHLLISVWYPWLSLLLHVLESIIIVVYFDVKIPWDKGSERSSCKLVPLFFWNAPICLWPLYFWQQQGVLDSFCTLHEPTLELVTSVRSLGFF